MIRYHFWFSRHHKTPICQTLATRIRACKDAGPCFLIGQAAHMGGGLVSDLICVTIARQIVRPQLYAAPACELVLMRGDPLDFIIRSLVAVSSLTCPFGIYPIPMVHALFRPPNGPVGSSSGCCKEASSMQHSRQPNRVLSSSISEGSG
jgi:hypothetical protein